MSEQEIFNFATIGEVFEDGVSLIFDGQDSATEKHYKVNTSIVFKAGDRVKILADSGTYVVEYVVGLPKQPGEEFIGVPAGGTEGQSLVKNTATNYDVSWGNPNAGSVVNKYKPTMAAYNIYFQTDYAGNFYIRLGTSGTWKKITVG